MKFEHFALNVASPIEMGRWYENHLRFEIVRQKMEAPFTTFMADESGQVML